MTVMDCVGRRRTALHMAAWCIFWAVVLMPFYCDRNADYLAELSKAIREDEGTLLYYAVRVRAGSIPIQGDKCGDPRATIAWLPITSRISTVTMDDNKNVYFILTDSWVNFDVGFVLRNGDCELLGDQCEPKIRYAARLFGDWWYFKAS